MCKAIELPYYAIIAATLIYIVWWMVVSSVVFQQCPVVVVSSDPNGRCGFSHYKHFNPYNLHTGKQSMNSWCCTHFKKAKV